MTRNEFAFMCGQYAIDPAIALECDAVREALKTTRIVTTSTGSYEVEDHDAVRKALEENF